MTSAEEGRRDEGGFTLIELVVVVLIIAVLIAIAIPAFVGAQNRARDRSAQSDLRAGLIAARTLATDHDGKFLTAGGTVLEAADLQAVEPTISFVDVPLLPADEEVGVRVLSPAGESLQLLRRSAAGTVFAVFATSDGKSRFCTDPTETLSESNCTGDSW